MQQIHPYIKNLIETNIDLIESEQYESLMRRCRPQFRKDLRDSLKEIGISIDKNIINDRFGALIDPTYINKSIKKILSDNNITYHKAYNDKEKTGRKFKYEGLSINISDKRKLEDLIIDFLESEAVDYDYVSVHERPDWRFHRLPIDLIVRITAPEY